MKFLQILILSSLYCIPSLAAEFSTVCERFSDVRGGYCIHTPIKNASNDILYYLHGAGGSEKTWQDDDYYPGQIRKEWSDQNAQFPTIVSLSFGEIWLLAEKNSSEWSGLFEVLTQKVIPTIEANLGGLKGRRLLVGESMGGFNSVQLALKSRLFSRAAILCAPMSEMSPFATQGEIDATIYASRAWRYYRDIAPALVLTNVKTMLEIVREFYPTADEWASGDPLQLAARAEKDGAPEIYLAAGAYDAFVLYEGNEKFASVLKKGGLAVDWRPQWGGHCAIDIPSLARFLVK